MKLKKRRKSSRMHGKNMGTHGTGARKNNRDSGHKGGKGMAGTGKRADHKKTLITKLYGHGYFGKKGITSKGAKRDKRDRINVGDIQERYKAGELDLSNHKILGKGEVKGKFTIKAKEASKSAIEKIEKAGGKIILEEVKKIETPLVEHHKKKKEVKEPSKGDSGEPKEVVEKKIVKGE